MQIHNAWDVGKPLFDAGQLPIHVGLYDFPSHAKVTYAGKLIKILMKSGF